MKKIFSYILAVMAVAGFSTSCSDDKAILVGEGRVKLSMKIDDNVKVQSREISQEEKASLEESCKIYVYSSQGLIRKYKGVSEIPADLWLVSGEYRAEAWAGDSVPASFDKKYYKGNASFTVSPSAVADAKINCKIANVVTSVKWDASVDEVLKNYKMEISHSKGTLEFNTENATAKGYFMMPKGESKLVYKITGTTLGGEEYTQEGEIADVKGTTEYAITVNFESKEFDPVGGGMFEVVVDEKVIEVKDQFEITAVPRISASFDLTKPKTGEAGTFNKITIYVSTVEKLVGLDLSGLNAIGFASSDVINIFESAEHVRNELATFGLSVDYPLVTDEKPEGDERAARISFASSMLNKLSNGVYNIGIKATDNFGKVGNAILTIDVSNDAVKVSEALAGDVWATSAILNATIAKEGSTGVGVEYRKPSGNWTKVYADNLSRSSAFTVTLTGLEPGVTYEYRAFADNDGEGKEFTSSKVFTFTTESALQLPNNSFEDWCQPKKAILPAASEGELYWDSGNHGSTTLNVNITQSDATVKNSGNYSAKLQSQFVGVGIAGKFAAGNIFTGKYLATDGTDGVLGWGRQFNSRPQSLSAYVKYNPAKVDYINDDAQDRGCVKGENDKGTIYVALLDNHTESHNDATFPVVIKTKNGARLFSKDDSNVIAYGQWTSQESTSSDNSMVKIDIPIEYKRTDIKPTAILVVCSASFWGDYFSGGNGSVLYVDDITLNY